MNSDISIILIRYKSNASKDKPKKLRKTHDGMNDIYRFIFHVVIIQVLSE